MMRDKPLAWMGVCFYRFQYEEAQDGALRADLQPYESIQHLGVFKRCGTPTQVVSPNKFEQISLTSQLFWGPPC